MTIETWIVNNGLLFSIGIIIISVWDTIWKLMAMWKAAERKSKAWFVLLSIINSVGILPIIYLVFVARRGNNGERMR